MSVYQFEPILQERIWGGRRLAELGRDLPEGKNIGESWELVDRAEACSRIAAPGGKEKTLHDLWTGRRREVFGRRAPETERFPILLKILDAKESLSIQVHPPASAAAELKGEPKTEMWYVLATQEGAKIYVGLKKGVTRQQFEKTIGTPELPQLLHVLPTEPHKAMFLPSGRVHAIGAGNLIFEIQQNSDTTYRVDDWNRVDAKGNPRELHIEASLKSIRFQDQEPVFMQPHGERMIECEHFRVMRQNMARDEFRSWLSDGSTFQYHFVLFGEVRLNEEGPRFKEGSGFLVSADHGAYELLPGEEGAEVLAIQHGV
jgi:mannose-6-phosphate isomerase